MRRASVWFVFVLTLPAAAVAQVPVSTHVTFNTYAAGLHVAELDAGLDLGPANYKIELAYHTTGMTSVFVHGHQYDMVSGRWIGTDPRPNQFLALGHWRGQERTVRIEYDGTGTPIVRELKPQNDEERETVPASLHQRTIDAISAMAQLIRTVEKTGRCDGIVRTYDGRRLAEVRAVTAGEDILEPSSRSIFAGRALRCDFTGRLLAGFKVDDDRAKQARPLHGTAWLAPLVNGGPRLPVRISFQTRWFGDMTAYLTAFGDGATIDVDRHKR